jgi:hypothetical protein
MQPSENDDLLEKAKSHQWLLFAELLSVKCVLILRHLVAHQEARVRMYLL